MGFNLKIVPEGDDVTISFAGTLDETSQLPKFTDPVKGALRLDLQNLALINSVGIHKWITWMRQRDGKQKSMVLAKCRPIIVNQINILKGFLPDYAVVESFYVPYCCESCGYDEEKLLARGIDFDDRSQFSFPSERKCPSCGGILGLDIVEERYFHFIMKKGA